MKKIIHVFLAVTILGVASVFLFQNRSGSAPQAATLLPASTLVFVDAPSLPALRANLGSSPLASLWNEPEFQTFLATPLAALRNAMGNEELDSKTINETLAWPQGETFVAVTRFTVTPSIQFGIVMGADMKSRKLPASGALVAYERQLKKYSPQTTRETKKYLGVSYTTVTAGPQHLSYGFLGTMLLAATSEDDFRDAIGRYTGKLTDDTLALASNAGYQNVLTQLPEPHDLHTFVNVGQLVSNFGMVLLAASQSGASGALQGIAAMQAYGVSMNANPTGIIDTGVSTYTADRSVEAPLAGHTLAVAAADAAYYSAQSADLATGYTKLLDTVAKSGNPQMVAIASAFDKQLADAGVRLADDFLAHLGPEVAYIGNWRDGARFPDLALVVEVKDPNAAQAKFGSIVAAITKAVASPDGRLSAEDLVQDGETLHVVRTGTSVLSPTYVLTKQFFIIALSVDYARELITQIHNGKSTLAATADYKTAISHLPAGGSELTYCDLRKVIGGLFALAHATPTTNATPFALPTLPKTETITRHLGTFVATTMTTPRTATTTSYSTIGKPATMIIGLAGAISAAQPWLAQLPPLPIPGLSTTSSDTPARVRPSGNQTATSQTPSP